MQLPLHQVRDCGFAGRRQTGEPNHHTLVAVEHLPVVAGDEAPVPFQIVVFRGLFHFAR